MERYELGQLLLNKGLITRAQLEKALLDQRQSKKFLGEILVGNGYVTREQLVAALTEQTAADEINLSKFQGIKSEVVRLIPENIARRYVLLAVAKTDEILTVAMSDPADIVAIDAIKRLTGCRLRVLKADEKEILQKIEKFYMDTSNLDESLAAMVEKEEETDSQVDVEQLRVAAEDAPIVRFVNSLFIQALEKRATDIHLEPQAESVTVRFRVDGVLQPTNPPPKSAYPGVVTRLKILSNLDIGERRLPQDGRMKIKLGLREVDIRISTMPTVYGEKIVMRLLDKEMLLVKMETLGFEERELEIFKEALSRPYGMIIVTGPTGSGKTTTLYSGLSFINSPEKNIMTVEDPVEYELPGINQVNVRPKIGLTFASALRTFLRQDPDVIMVGEIRDLETAQIAIQASLTGHLVLSTLHTNDTVSSVSRLNYMGVEPYLLAASLNLILAQRLVRTICKHCQIDDPEGLDMLREMGIPAEGAKIRRGEGCRECDFSGYLGRMAIYELLSVDRKVRNFIVQRAPEDSIRDYAISQGMVTLRQAALSKALKGVTTVKEALAATLVI
ncbi:MAG: Flp pilus assembly complex ATPase component TadA [Candidatus Omnitrophica bacterium]|nr:Flp pilus assembly complex ATPase component TadA [Candidatus Omnitrophota bacterium]